MYIHNYYKKMQWLLFSENCYRRVEEETKLIKDKIIQKLGNQPIEQEVVVLYEGENMPEKVTNFKINLNYLIFSYCLGNPYCSPAVNFFRLLPWTYTKDTIFNRFKYASNRLFSAKPKIPTRYIVVCLYRQVIRCNPLKFLHFYKIDFYFTA